jgi:AraC family transcriptional regulator
VLRHHVALRVDLNPRRAAIGAPALRRVIEYIDAHLGQGLSLAELAGVAGLSPFHFARVFKRTTGLAPHQFVVRCRVERARDLLVRGQATVADVAAHVGFADQSHLSAHFKRVFGMTPAAFVRSMRNG